MLKSLALAALFCAFAAPLSADEPAPKREKLAIDGRPGFLMRPTEVKKKPIPWVMYAPMLGQRYPREAEYWMFNRFLAAGIAVAGVDVGESYGSPAGRATFDALHKHLTEKEGYDPKVCLLGRSRGGLMIYGWAADHPEKVRAIVGIYPVCNLESYPGLAKACGAYGMTESELKEKLAEHNPIDRLAPLIEAKVPIFHIHGDVDEVVPLADNSQIVVDRYRKAGGKITLVVPKGQGHSMWEGFFKCQELVDFLIENANGANAK